MKNNNISRRLMAMSIDWFIASLLHTALLILILRFGYINEIFPKIIMLPTDYHSVIYFSFIIFYYIIQEVFFNTTIGKRILNLKVVSFNLERPTFISVVVRNLFRIIDQFLLVGSITIFFNGKGKRLGDIVSKTLVVDRKTVE